MTPGWGSATRPVFLGDTAGGISSQWCLHCSHYPSPSPSPRAWAPRFLHCSLLGAWTVMGTLKLLKKYLLNEWTDWISRISFSPECSKMRGRVWQKRRQVKKWVRQATWGSSLKFIHLTSAYSSFLGQGNPCPLHTHFRNFTWCEQWNSLSSHPFL